jgi:integrase
MGKQVLSALLSYAVEEGRLGSNPCLGLSNLYSADRSDIIWTDADLAKFAETASPEIMFALRLAALTGLRQSDLLRLEPAHVGDLAIELPSDKSRGKLTYTVPMYGELRALLAEIDAYWDRRRAEIVAEAEANGKPAPLLPRTSILFTSDLKPWSSGFGSSWNKACWAALPAEARDAELARSAAAKKAIAEREKAGKAVTDEERKAASPDITAAGWKLHFHDARGTAATKFYLARDAKGERIFSIEEIAEILAWSVKRVENIIKRYVTKDALLREKIRRMDGGDG